MGYRDVKRHSYPLPPQAMSVDDATLRLKYEYIQTRQEDHETTQEEATEVKKMKSRWVAITRYLLDNFADARKSHKDNKMTA